MKVALLGTFAASHEALLRAKLGDDDWEFAATLNDDSDKAYQAAITGADVIIAQTFRPEFRDIVTARLFQVPGAGWERVDPAALPACVTICNAYGHDDGIGEFVLLGMLEWCHRLGRMDASFRAGAWVAGPFGGGAPQLELAGKTVGIVGLGRIGVAVARRAKVFDTEVLAVNRTPKQRPAEVDWLGTMAELPELLRRSDFVVLCCALTAETTGLIDAAALAGMKKDAVIVNVARGPVVDEAALYAALRDRTIGGAVIDTWYRYPTPDDQAPRPSQFPFHELDNVIMTPHVAGWTTGQIERRWQFIAENLRRFRRGEPVENVVRVTG